MRRGFTGPGLRGTIEEGRTGASQMTSGTQLNNGRLRVAIFVALRAWVWSKVGTRMAPIRCFSLRFVYVPAQVEPLESILRDGVALISLATNQ